MIADILQSVWEFLRANLAAVGVSSVIAVCALVFGMYTYFATSRQTRTHNRLTVTPHITYFTGSQVLPKDAKVRFTWGLVNHGLGPAVIKSHSISLDGVPVDAGNASESLRKAFDTVSPYSRINLVGDHDHRMGKGERWNIFVVKFFAPTHDEPPNSAEDKFRAGVKRFKVEVKYTSLYGKEFTFKHP